MAHSSFSWQPYACYRWRYKEIGWSLFCTLKSARDLEQHAGETWREGHTCRGERTSTQIRNTARANFNGNVPYYHISRTHSPPIWELLVSDRGGDPWTNKLITALLYAGTIICTADHVELQGCSVYSFIYKPLNESVGLEGHSLVHSNPDYKRTWSKYQSPGEYTPPHHSLPAQREASLISFPQYYL